MGVDVVVGDARLVDVAVRPVLVRHPHEALRPREGGRRIGAVGQRRAELAVQGQQPVDRRGAAAAPAALGGDAERPDVPARRLDPALCAVVARVQQPEVELGLRRQPQLAQRRVVGVVVALVRHRHVDPVERAVERGGERVGDADELAGVGGLGEVAVLVVAVTEMEAELDGGGDHAGEPQQPLDDAGAHVLEPDRDRALQHRELVPRVPLDRELVGGDGAEDALDLRAHLRLVDRLELGLVVERHERADRRERRRQRDEEAAGGRDRPVALEPRERAVGLHRRRRVAELLEGHPARVLAGAQPQLRERAVRRGARRADLELRQRAEQRVLPDDPVGAGAGLAVGQAADAVAQRVGDAAEDLLGAPERDAAHQVHADRRALLHRSRETIPRVNGHELE